MKQNTSRNDYRDMRGVKAYNPSADKSLNGPYFEKYDGVSDPVNVVRELNAAVYEPIEDRGVLQARHIAERQFSTRWKNTAPPPAK